jgi:NAD(P)-dependent dehydrogenase (short-subunit alcohol dehydrogenase family)
MTTADERRLVVTGAGSGIGLAVCEAATDQGWRVVGIDRDALALDRVAGATGSATIVGDVTDEDAVELAVDHAVELLGGLPDALVTAAGVYDVKASLDVSLSDFLRVLTINTAGSFLFARALVNRIRRARPASNGCSIVFLSSIAAQRGDGAEPAVAYCASKGAVEAMTRQLAVEWSALDVRVNAVSPGVIQTPMLRLMDDPAAGQRYLRESVPLARLGTAAEVADTCLFLLDEASGYVTGAVVPVDGGASVQ